MKIDIVRAWKDEKYRQTLNEDQLHALPANPAGELTDSEMETVCGGGGGLPMPAAVTPAAPVASHVHHVYRHSSTVVATTAAASSSSVHAHSWSLLCDVSIFSLNVIQVPIIPIASGTSQCCSECD